MSFTPSTLHIYGSIPFQVQVFLKVQSCVLKNRQNVNLKLTQYNQLAETAMAVTLTPAQLALLDEVIALSRSKRQISSESDMSINSFGQPLIETPPDTPTDSLMTPSFLDIAETQPDIKQNVKPGIKEKPDAFHEPGPSFGLEQPIASSSSNSLRNGNPISIFRLQQPKKAFCVKFSTSHLTHLLLEKKC